MVEHALTDRSRATAPACEQACLDGYANGAHVQRQIDG